MFVLVVMLRKENENVLYLICLQMTPGSKYYVADADKFQRNLNLKKVLKNESIFNFFGNIF